MCSHQSEKGVGSGESRIGDKFFLQCTFQNTPHDPQGSITSCLVCSCSRLPITVHLLLQGCPPSQRCSVQSPGTSRCELNGGGISQRSNSKVFSFGAQKVKHLLATHCKHVSVFNMLTVLCSPAHVFRKETGYDV